MAIKYLNEMKHEVRRLRWENRFVVKSIFEREIEKEEEDVSLVRKREKDRWEEYAKKMSKCRSLIEDLKDAIDERNFEKVRETRIKIADRCAPIIVSKEGTVLPIQKKSYRRVISRTHTSR
jgi:hypothetical protein